MGASGMIDPFKFCSECLNDFLFPARVEHGEHNLSERTQKFRLEQSGEGLRNHLWIVAKYATTPRAKDQALVIEAFGERQNVSCSVLECV